MIVGEVIISRAFAKHARKGFLQRTADEVCRIRLHHLGCPVVAMHDRAGGIMDQDAFANRVESLRPDSFRRRDRFNHALTVEHD
jgi:hypothetical protein